MTTHRWAVNLPYRKLGPNHTELVFHWNNEDGSVPFVTRLGELFANAESSISVHCLCCIFPEEGGATTCFRMSTLRCRGMSSRSPPSGRLDGGIGSTTHGILQWYGINHYRLKTHQLVSAYCDQVLGDVEHIEYLRKQGSRYVSLILRRLYSAAGLMLP